MGELCVCVLSVPSPITSNHAEVSLITKGKHLNTRWNGIRLIDGWLEGVVIPVSGTEQEGEPCLMPYLLLHENRAWLDTM